MVFSTLGEPSLVSAAVNAEIMVLWNATCSLVVGYVRYLHYTRICPMAYIQKRDSGNFSETSQTVRRRSEEDHTEIFVRTACSLRLLSDAQYTLNLTSYGYLLNRRVATPISLLHWFYVYRFQEM